MTHCASRDGNLYKTMEESNKTPLKLGILKIHLPLMQYRLYKAQPDTIFMKFKSSLSHSEY